MKAPEQQLAIDCLTGKTVRLDRVSGASENVQAPYTGAALPFVGPGLVDLQVNGVNGIDFNDASLTVDGLLKAAEYLLQQGVTTFFPTIITNEPAVTCQLLSTINQACSESSWPSKCIGGIHLEGPFISKLDGARGAHPAQHVQAPDWELFTNFQRAAGNRIKLITLSPEWDSAPEFIARCCKSGVLVAIGHSIATPEQVAAAVKAGATLSTHIGNAVPLVLPRHTNIIWEQLSQPKLYASLIADGYHVPDSFISVVIKAKGNKCFLVSDSTQFTGMAPGHYRTYIGGDVELQTGGRLSLAGGEGLLAGAAKTLLQNVEYLVESKLATPSKAWQMASVVPGRLVNLQAPGDRVVFQSQRGKVAVLEVFKEGARVV